MKLLRARVQNYRSIRDSGWIEIEPDKTILVGPNEAGKTVLLRALQQINPPEEVNGFDPLRDFPRSELSKLDLDDTSRGSIRPDQITVVEAEFSLDEAEDEAVKQIDALLAGCIYVVERRLDNSSWHSIRGGPKFATYQKIKSDLLRLASHIDLQVPEGPESESEGTHRQTLNAITGDWKNTTEISGERAVSFRQWLDSVWHLVDEDNEAEQNRIDRISEAIEISERIDEALKYLDENTPIFVYFSNYFRVRARIHLSLLADRLEGNILEGDEYDRGNECLLKLLGFSARELSDLGNAVEPDPGDEASLKAYQDQLDRRRYRLSAASRELTDSINKVWQPDPDKAEADELRVVADQQYLKVVVEDDLDAEVELDQRSEGYQWLVSFFVVFFAEAADRHQNSILLLDEPGLSLHGLKQREFRTTVSRLSESNQILYTTHSPFMVGPDELDLVRVVEMRTREKGTKVHTTIAARDSTALLPLQEALGYDLAQSLFTQQRNLVLEGLTDYWYVEATAALLNAAGEVTLNDRISLVPAGDAGKVVYFATILHANNLKVAALLDSDAAGNSAAEVETLIHTLGNRNILRTADAYLGVVKWPEIEDLLRDTLICVAKEDLCWDIEAAANRQPERPVVDVFVDKIGKKDFSKYRLAKAYLRWAKEHEAANLTDEERSQWKKLIATINRALR